MDENKEIKITENEELIKEENDILISEETSTQETDNFVESDQDLPREEQSQQEYVSQFGDIEGLEDYTVTITEPEKKKFFLFNYINPSIFVAICVFLAALLGFSAYYVFGSKTITGTWVYTIENQSQSTADQVEKIDQYYVFESADSNGNGKLYTYCDGAEQCSDYTITSEGDKKILKLGNTEFYYEVEGIKLFGGATLKLTSPEQTDQTTGQTIEAQTIELAQGKNPDYEEQSMDNYSVDDNLVGAWEADRTSLYYGYYPIEYTEKVTIYDNGVLKINYINKELGLNNSIYYAYTTKSGKLTIQRVTSKDKDTVEYKVKDGKLTFTDKTKNSMFYDEVFGGVTYYVEGKKPAATQPVSDTQPETSTQTKTDKAK